MGIPNGHRHIRTIIEMENETLILQEATIASIVRAFTNLKTHPKLYGIELLKRKCQDKKEGYAEFQLLESNKMSKEVISEISKLVKSS